MNLTRVLNVALPEIPAREISLRPPRIPPDLVFKEHIEDGQPVVRVVVRGQDAMFNFPPANWTLVQLFDGQRSYREIAETYSGQTGREYSEGEIREFADSLESLEFWYKTPQERNIQLMQKTAEERQKLVKSRKSRFGDLSEIAFPAINPDKFVTWLYGHTRFVYTWWFSLITLAVFSIAVGITITHWDEIGRDTIEFFNFTDKSLGDVFLFYILAVIALCWHELGHAHACKHYGGRVPAMGFLLIYLTPAFFTDTTEGFVKGNRYQRFVIAMAGAWSELYICAVATPIWWGTPPGSIAHTAAYQMVLMTGIAGLFLNWNPLMKLDGYYMLSEVLGFTDLKENSTAFASAWVRKNVFQLPVEVPYVPRRRRLGFAVYAVLSGLYSYTVLYVLARFAGNVFRNFNPEWSFIPELVVAGLIFRSRIRKLVSFMKFVYLDKKDRIEAWFRARTGRVLLAGVVVFLLLPLWHERIEGRFVLEPAERALVRNVVPGSITEVLAREGISVVAGETLLRLRNLPLQSKVEIRESELAVASVKANQAAIRYANLGAAIEERNQVASQSRELELQARSLEVRSPMGGTVLTPRLADLLGAYVREGTELVEVADLSQMRARVYVSDYDMHQLHVGAGARLNIDGIPRIWEAKVATIMPISSEINPAIADVTKYKGLSPPTFYIADLEIANPQKRLKPGMIGAARIYGQRRSLGGHLARAITRFFGRKVW
jgi:putative peptide zinc metalloprotease protein